MGLFVLPIITPTISLPVGQATLVIVAPDIHTDAQRIADLERKIADAKGSADNAWMLVSAVNPILKDVNGNVMAAGLIEGNAHQLLNQLVGVGIAWVLGIVGTLAILVFVDKVIGLRVSPEHETQGLDLSQHGEEGYDGETSM